MDLGKGFLGRNQDLSSPYEIWLSINLMNNVMS